jgi:hypothetical protein
VFLDLPGAKQREGGALSKKITAQPPSNNQSVSADRRRAMLDARETTTILAALLYWREEMCPHGREVMQPYFDTVAPRRAAFG